MADVTLNTVSKSYGPGSEREFAVDSVSLEIANGSFNVLLGPTGAGKTTMLRLVAGLEKPDNGSIHIGDRDVTGDTPAQRNVAMVFQQYSLYPHLTVRENLAFPLKSPLLKTSPAEIKKRIAEVAEVLRISDKLDNKSIALSGGEMQRVSIGRALVRQPEVFLMDEPLSSLDAKLRSELRLELKRLQADLGATVLYVTHDQIEAMTMATQVGVLHDGKLVQHGSPREIYENPKSIYVASRLGLPRINTLPADFFAGAPTAAATIGMRPENIVIDSGQPGAKSGVVDRVEHLGDQTRLHITVQNHSLVTLIHPTLNIGRGDSVSLLPQSPLYFAADGSRVL